MVSPPASPGAKASIIGSKRAALNSSQYQGKAEKKIEIPRLNSSLIAEYNEARAEALPLTRAANYDVAMSYFRCGDSNYDPDKASKSKVSLWRMLSYSTPKERAWMVFGVIMGKMNQCHYV